MMLDGIISRQCGDGSWALLSGSSSHMPTNRASDRVSLNKYGELTNNPGTLSPLAILYRQVDGKEKLHFILYHALIK